MAIGDLVESLSDLPTEQIEAMDASLRAQGAMTFTEVCARFWSKIKRIRKRGSVRNDEEYYALRNVVDALPEGERSEVWGLLAAYEGRVAAR